MPKFYPKNRIVLTTALLPDELTRQFSPQAIGVKVYRTSNMLSGLLFCAEGTVRPPDVVVNLREDRLRLLVAEAKRL